MISQYSLPELEAFLASIPLFAAADEVTRRQLAEQLEPVHAAAGEVIIMQGEAGDGLFVVVSGQRVQFAVGTYVLAVERAAGRGRYFGRFARTSRSGAGVSLR